MGREALCECTFAGTTAKVKALLETNEIILRGDIRMTAPLKALKNIRVQSETLCFNVDEHPFNSISEPPSPRAGRRRSNRRRPRSPINSESPIRPSYEPSAKSPTAHSSTPSHPPHKSSRAIPTSSSPASTHPNPSPPPSKKQRRNSPARSPSGSSTAKAPATRSTNPPSAPPSERKASWTPK